jgi:hypothetical protein
MRGKVTADAYSGWRRVGFTMRVVFAMCVETMREETMREETMRGCGLTFRCLKNPVTRCRYPNDRIFISCVMIKF